MAAVVFALILRGNSHAQCCRYRSGRVPYPKCIILALAALRKTAEPTVFTIGMENLAAAGKYFVPVCLVAYVPHKLVVGSVEYIVKRYGKFYHTEAGTKMPAMHTHAVYDKLPEFIANLWKLVFVQFFQVIRYVDTAQ